MKGYSGKAPSIQWYFKDWLSDKKLQRARSSTRGIWMNLLMYMMDDCNNVEIDCPAGRLEYMTIQNICSLGNCTEDEAWCFLEDAIEYNFCNIEMDKNRTFHVLSRRLSSDSEQRAKWREQKRKQRDNQAPKKDINGNVRNVSAASPAVTPTPSPIPTSKEVIKDQPSAGHFEQQVGTHFKAIKSHCDKISSFKNRNGFNPFEMVQRFVNDKRHPGAIEYVMRALSDEKYFSGIRSSPWRYANGIMKTQNQNFNENDAIKIHQKLKAMRPGKLAQFTQGMFEKL